MSDSGTRGQSAGQRVGGVRLRRVAWLLVVGAALGVAPRVSRAESVTAEATALFQEGVRLRNEGKTEAACAMFAESQRLEPTAGKLLNVADCHERAGRLATAWAEFVAASRLYQLRGDEEAVAECRRRAALLDSRLSRLTLRVERLVAGLVVKRNGQIIEAAQLEVPLPVDPGEYVITAEAPGYAPFRTSALVGLKRDDIVVTLPALAVRPASVPARGRPVAGYVTGGLGVAALGVGAAFGLMALSSNTKAERACRSEDRCSRDEALDARDRANVDAWVANVGVGAGLVGLAVSGFLLFAAPPGSKAGSSAGERGGMTISLQPGGLRVGVRFLTRGETTNGYLVGRRSAQGAARARCRQGEPGRAGDARGLPTAWRLR